MQLADGYFLTYRFLKQQCKRLKRPQQRIIRSFLQDFYSFNRYFLSCQNMKSP